MFLKELTEASGVSGNEKEVRDFIKKALEGYVDEIKVDRIGNLIVHKKASNSSGRKLMIAAHMDEIGLMVKDIDSSGLIKFMPVGGIDKRILVSKAVTIGDKKLPGVIGAKPIHLQKKNEWSKVLDIDDLYIDIGTSSKEDTEKHVSIGDYVAFDTEYDEIGDGIIKAKSLDDRVGCSILLDILRSDVDADIYGAFTVMEEVGLVGAGPAAYQIKPDVAIVLEGTICYETDDLDSHQMPTKLGEGPAISLIDRTTVYNRDLRDEIIRIAEANNIPYQYRKTAMGGNDSGKIHISGTGCATAGISVPTRYIHSPLSVISRADYDNTYRLVLSLIEEFKKGAI
ncbi:M42 family metallopeptidase [Gudongella sp. DL1XJH-153]|uniref:M42 family metallopeptidase n=1 Tax=Gudongella sp. DL1XJH-153 TaxID=3409804 RepID=UPI003BB76243